MAYKERSKAKTQLIYEALERRKVLTKASLDYLWAMRKGYEGECEFDGYTEKLTCDCLILNDLSLRKWRMKFQLDTTIITGEAVHIFEVKNYEGEYYWGREKLIKITGFKVENPNLKLESKKVKMEIFLERLGFRKEVRVHVVYINSHFHLRGVPEQEKLLFRSQIKRHMEDIDRIQTPLSPSDRKLAQMLKEEHHPDFVDDELPEYNFARLRKGVPCPVCGSLNTVIAAKTLRCAGCKGKAPAQVAIKRSIEEFQLLFPEERVTTRRMEDWCAVTDAKRIYRVLQKSWTPVRTGRHRYYV